jgi:hypothetical protein
MPPRVSVHRAPTIRRNRPWLGLALGEPGARGERLSLARNYRRQDLHNARHEPDVR